MIQYYAKKHLSGGRTYYSAEVSTRRSRFYWSCCCRKENEHDHQDTLKGIEERLRARDAKNEEYKSIPVGRVCNIDQLAYSVKEYGVRVLSPYVYKACIAWSEWPMDKPDERVTKQAFFTMGHPDLLPPPETLVDAMLVRVAEDSDQLTRSRRLRPL
jgi:hypothetical protein